jgi:hypothetical protein
MRIRIREPNGRALTLSREEIAVAVAPRVRAAVTEAERRRMNAFPGRALTARVLTGEQAHRSWHIAQLNRTLSPGVVDGLGLAFADEVLAAAATAADPPPAALDLVAPRAMALEHGLAVATSGEEIDVPGEAAFDALDLPLAAPQWLFDGASPPTVIDGELLPRNVRGRLREWLAEGRPVPRAGVIVLEPVEYDSLLDPTGEAALSQCERDLQTEAFDDEVRQESARLVYYAWPEEWLPLPVADLHWRNRLAWAIFLREAQLAASHAMPWWRRGVPAALVAFNAAWQPLFADRAAVVRKGGAPRAHLPLAAGGTRFLWQARIEQLAEHIAEARQFGADTAALAAMLRYLPPAGLLPRDAIDARTRTTLLLPATLRIDAAPVPLEQLDALLEDSASGGPIDLAVRDELRVLVPVPQSHFEPDLLVVEQADADGEFARAIDRFVDLRADWLRRRHSLREKARWLAVAIDGPNVPAVPSPAEDPLRLENERIAPLLPAPSGVLHVSGLLAGMHQHFIVDAPTPLKPTASDVLYAFVQLDRENPPREVMLQFFANGRWDQRAFWGEDLIGWGVAGTASRLRQGELPAAGSWLRLEVKAAALGLAGQEITGIAFTLFDGRAAWGPAGVVASDAPWLTEALVKGATQRGEGEGWTFIAAADADAPFEAAFGTAAVEGKRVVVEVETLQADKSVGPLRVGARGRQQTVAAMIDARGLRATIEQLRASINKTSDAIDFGFIRVQSDLYRLRQSVLKQSQATRFAVSPALTQIAELDSAAATREQLAAFYGDIKQAPPGAAPAPSPGPVNAPQPSRAAFTTFGASALSPELLGAAVSPRISGVAGAADLRLATDGQVITGSKTTDFGQFGNIFGADALTGVAEVRNVSIAARMEQPRAVETKNFAVATRIEITQRLAEADLDLDEVTVAGVPTGAIDDKSGQPLRKVSKLVELSDFATALTDPSPDASKADEAHYFLGGVDVSDFTIGLLRNFEGLSARYRTALARCEKAAEAIVAQQSSAAARIAAVERELAEARHDVATTRALLAEETARVNAINARRDAVIAEQVKFLAYARPRWGERLAPLPSRELDNAFEPDVVPACFAQHDDPPSEVAAMLEVIRRAPLAWFPHARGLLDLIDRLPQLERLTQIALRPLPAAGAAQAAAPLAAASMKLVQTQAGVTAQLRVASTAVFTAAAGLAERRTQLAGIASLADLCSIFENVLVTRRAAQEYERIATVAGCLHARLGEVKPVLRLAWAEQFSQFDAQVELGDLSLLPRLGEVPQQLREDIVELARWLRGRAARDEPRAQALVNDLLRVCLLAASHSPVNEIVTGRVLRPLPLAPGTILPIRPFLLDRVRLGQTVQFFDGGKVAATAVVHDLHDDTAQVRVTQTWIAGSQATEATAVRFITGAF